MSSDFSRTERIDSSIKKALATIIRDEVKDPRLGMVTIQAVQTLRDLSQAKVYFTLMPGQDRKQAQAILQRASGFIRHQLGRAVQLRSLPQLQFIYDDSIEEGARLQGLIESLVPPHGDND